MSPLPSPSASWLRRCFPFLGWCGELRDGAVLRADLIAGLTVALVLIPQAMAYAQLAGLPPYYGLYAAFLPPLIGALWGSSRQLATGPVAMVSLLTGATLAPLAASGINVIPVAIMLALASGLIQLAMGMLRLGVVISFFSHPMLLGLTNAAALIIASSQLDKFFGVDVTKGGNHLWGVWLTLEKAWQQAYWPAAAMGSGALVIMIICRRLSRRWGFHVPAVLVAVIITTLLSWSFNYEAHSAQHAQSLVSEATAADSLAAEQAIAQGSPGRVVGAVPEGLPSLAWPRMDWALLLDLWGPLLVIALVGFVEAVAIAKAMAAQTRHRHDANQELIGQGLANIAGAMSQSYPCSGSYSRSAVNLSSGARTGFASVVTALVVGLCLLWFTPLLWHIPEATLAAVIFMAVASLIKIRPLRHVWRVCRGDAVVALVTFAVTLIAAPRLEIGILCGVVLSVLLYLARTARPRLAVLSRHPDGTLKDAAVNNLPTSAHILPLRLDGRLYFANTGYFEDLVAAKLLAQPQTKVVILFAQGINSIDASGEEALRSLAEMLHKKSIPLFICGAKLEVREVLHRGGWAEEFGQDKLIADEASALERAHSLLEPEERAQSPLLPALPAAH